MRVWRDIRRGVLERDGRACILCRATEDLTVHHTVPKHLCRDDTPRNLTTLCRRCHDLIEVLDQLPIYFHWIDIYLRRTAAPQ